VCGGGQRQQWPRGGRPAHVRCQCDDETATRAHAVSMHSRPWTRHSHACMRSAPAHTATSRTYAAELLVAPSVQPAACVAVRRARQWLERHRHRLHRG
jgi:hypothetical protein